MPVLVHPSSRLTLVLVTVLTVVLSTVAPSPGHAQSGSETNVGAVRFIVEPGVSIDAATAAGTWSPAITTAWPQFSAMFATEPADQVTIRFVPTLTPETIAGLTRVTDFAWVTADGTTAVIAAEPMLALTPIESANIIRNVLARAFIQQAGGNQVPPGIVAGIARYLETPIIATQARLGSLVQGLHQAGTLPTWTEVALDQPATLSPEQRSANAYAIVAFLADRYGVLGLRNLTTGFATHPDLDANLTATFGQSADALTGAWETFLPRWFATGWRENATAAFDLSRAEQLFDRGTYQAAVAEAERSQRLFTDIDDQIGLARVEALLAQCAVGLQADGLMLDAEAALNQHDYPRALAYVTQAEDLYSVLPPAHRPETMIERYRSLATTGIEADAHLAAAEEIGGNWFQAAGARGDALAAGNAFASLGDEDGRAAAATLLDEIDTRIWRMVYLLSAIVIGLIGWLVAWTWHRYPARLQWGRQPVLTHPETR